MNVIMRGTNGYRYYRDTTIKEFIRNSYNEILFSFDISIFPHLHFRFSFSAYTPLLPACHNKNIARKISSQK